MEMPSAAVEQWLNKLYVSVIDTDRSREAFKRTSKFTDPIFLKKVDDLSNTVDQLVFDASFAGDLPAIKAFISQAPQDVIDILVFRFNVRMLEFSKQPGLLNFPDKPDILAAFRLLLILNDQISNGPWPTH